MSEHNYALKFTPNAKADLDNIYNYIAFHFFDENSAAKIIAHIEKRIKHLKTMPFSAPIYDEPQYAGLNIHRLVIKQYIVFYLANEDKRQVEIIHVLHGRMDGAKALSDIINGN